MTDHAAARARIEAALRAVPWFCTQHQRPAAECSHEPANRPLIEVPDYGAMAHQAVATFAASERTRARPKCSGCGEPLGASRQGACHACVAESLAAARQEAERLRQQVATWKMHAYDHGYQP